MKSEERTPSTAVWQLQVMLRSAAVAFARHGYVGTPVLMSPVHAQSASDIPEVRVALRSGMERIVTFLRHLVGSGPASQQDDSKNVLLIFADILSRFTWWNLKPNQRRAVFYNFWAVKVVLVP